MIQPIRPRHLAEPRGDHSRHGTGGQHHQAEVLLGRSDRPDHAQLAQAPLGDHDEAGRRHQSDEQQDDGGDGEHGRCGHDVDGQGAAATRSPDRRSRAGGTMPLDLHRSRTRSLTAVDAESSDGGTSANSSSSSPGFSTRPTTVRSTPSSISRPPAVTANADATPSVMATSPVAVG